MMYEDVVRAADKAAALCKHFSYLADEEGADEVLRAVMSKARAVRQDGDELLVEFEDGELRARPGNDADVPSSLEYLFRKHRSLEYGGISLLHGSAEQYFGDLEEDELEEYEAFVAEMGDVPWSDVHVLIHDNSDFWVTHPHKTNPHGLPTLVCLGHDDPDNPDGALTTPHNPGAQFLNMLATLLG
jgi:hypothetical protein